MNAYAESMDPHTSYMAPTSADRFKQEMSQSLEGIGALLREEDNYIKIVEVIPGGPAFKGKQLKKEDKIIAVAQGDEGKMVDIVGWFVDDAVKLIKGPKSTVVRLQVISADAFREPLQRNTDWFVRKSNWKSNVLRARSFRLTMLIKIIKSV
jgi:carboxyl-terminal processing protease